MQIKKGYLLLTIGVLVVGIVLGTQIQSVVSGDNTFQQLRKLEEAFSFINKRYVEDVDSARLVEHAIEGMLESLDPHSNYITAQQMARWRERFDDVSFEGIGIYYEWISGTGGKDTLTVLMPITGGPSEEAGLVAGDRIIEVDGRDAVGWTTDDVENYLKGPKGTEVDVVVKRPGYRETLTITITRDELPVHTVNASFMIDDQTGYIRLERFARSTYTEFMDAMGELQQEGMERLVLDLRNNAGGFLEMAHRIAGEFLDRGDMIVYTRSRHADLNREYRAPSQGSLADMPLIVLVNENSASASEIVAGAVQDHDRGLVVGRRTFGKGLVQQQFPMSDGSVLQLTISQYYTPSGRLIQTPYEGLDREEVRRQRMDLFYRDMVVDAKEYVDTAPDSLKFETERGRIVLGGGGILPDYVVRSDTTSPLIEALIRGRVDQDYSRIYLEDHSGFLDEWRDSQAGFIHEFSLGVDDWDAFVDFARQADVEIVPDDVAEERKSEDDEVRVFSESEFDEDRQVIEARIKMTIARRIWGISAYYLVSQQIDKDLNEAMSLWTPAEELASYHMNNR